MEAKQLSQRASDIVGDGEGHAGRAPAVYKIGHHERVIHDHSGEGEHSFAFDQKHHFDLRKAIKCFCVRM